MNTDLLSKLKGNKATFAVHSKSPFTPAAAMGAMMGQSQKAGSFFQFSEGLLPVVQSPVQLPPCSGGMVVDFKADWADYLRETGLPSYGLKSEDEEDEKASKKNTMRFLNARRRIPPAQPRIVLESRELKSSIPPQFAQDYLALKEVIEKGGDLKPYLSRRIPNMKRLDKNDPCLNAWGFQHLHFQPHGTDHILFCKITDSAVFAIQVFPHKSGDNQQWVRGELIEIMHDNWPEEIASGVLRGLPPDEGEDSVEKRAELRGNNANFITKTKDGTLYLSPGGGLSCSGENAEDRLNCAKIFSELKYWQQIAEKNEAEFRNALKVPPIQPLWIKMMFDNPRLCIYEAITGMRIAINVQTNG